MRASTIGRLAWPSSAVLIGAWLLWTGWDSYAAGAQQAEWLPWMVFAVLIPLAYFVPFVGEQLDGDRESEQFTLASWATAGVFAAWAVVGGLFYVTYGSDVVVIPAILGASYTILFLKKRIAEGRSRAKAS